MCCNSLFSYRGSLPVVVDIEGCHFAASRHTGADVNVLQGLCLVYILEVDSNCIAELPQVQLLPKILTLLVRQALLESEVGDSARLKELVSERVLHHHVVAARIGFRRG